MCGCYGAQCAFFHLHLLVHKSRVTVALKPDCRLVCFQKDEGGGRHLFLFWGEAWGREPEVYTKESQWHPWTDCSRVTQLIDFWRSHLIISMFHWKLSLWDVKFLCHTRCCAFFPGGLNRESPKVIKEGMKLRFRTKDGLSFSGWGLRRVGLPSRGCCVRIVSL